MLFETFFVPQKISWLCDFNSSIKMESFLFVDAVGSQITPEGFSPDVIGFKICTAGFFNIYNNILYSCEPKVDTQVYINW